jgi:hypothetical protein
VVVGVDVPDVVVEVVGVAVPDLGVSVPDGVSAAGVASVIDASPISVGAVPPRRGESSSSVVAGCKLSDDTVLEGDRCRPASSNLTSAGRFVDAERKSRTSEMEFEGRTFSGMPIELPLSADVSYCVTMFYGRSLLFPPPILTKIWTLSAGNDDADDDEDDRERMMKFECG